MEIKKTDLPEVLVIEPRIFPDNRGCFYESYHVERFQAYGLPSHFVQDNCSRSVKKVVRGLHYQLERPQGKLVYVTQGHILDIAVDIRIGSPTFGKSVAIELSEHNCRQLYIPVGFAHGFCVLSDRADVSYKCTDLYHPSGEQGIFWDDPDLKIQWPYRDAIVSSKDAAFPRLKDIPTQKLFSYL